MNRTDAVRWLNEIDDEIGQGFHVDTAADEYSNPELLPENFEASRLEYLAFCEREHIDPAQFAIEHMQSFAPKECFYCGLPKDGETDHSDCGSDGYRDDEEE